MPDTLKWMMELQDRMSGPAKTISNGLVEVREATERAHESITAIAEGMGLERLAEKAVDLGREFIHTLMEEKRFTDESRIGFEVLLGSVDAANDMLKQTRQFAINAGRPLEDVVGSYKAMLSGGVAAKNVESLMNASADLAAIGGGNLRSWADAFVNIQNPMRGLGQSLGQFRNALGEGGIDLLAKKLGFATHGFAELHKKLNETPVKPQLAFKALTETLMNMEHGPLGTAGVKFGDLMGGAIQSIKTELVGLFEFGGEGEQSGILKFVLGLRDALQPGGPLVSRIKEGVDSLMEGLGVLSGPGGFDGFIKSMKDGTVLGADFKETMRDVGAFIRGVGQALGVVIDGVAALGKAMHHLQEGREALKRMDEGSSGAFVPRPGNADDERLYKMLNEGNGSGPGGARSDGSMSEAEYLKAHPPKAMAEGGRVTGPTLAMIGEGGEPENVIPDSKMGRGGVTVHLQQIINVAAEAGVHVEELARKIHSIGVGELQSAFDSLALSMGTT